MKFTPGDLVAVTNPQQPTGHKGGETGVVIATGTVAGTEVVQIQEDRDGSQTGVYPEEITKR